jgi:hypothetical protein
LISDEQHFRLTRADVIIPLVCEIAKESASRPFPLTPNVDFKKFCRKYVFAQRHAKSFSDKPCMHQEERGTGEQHAA